MSNCLICNSPFDPFIDFGDMPIANDFSTQEDSTDDFTFRMQVGFCSECYMVQLLEQPDREKMFHENYAYFASTSNYMVDHFKSFSDSITSKNNLDKDSLVVELGSNDGIMLQNADVVSTLCTPLSRSLRLRVQFPKLRSETVRKLSKYAVTCRIVPCGSSGAAFSPYL